MDLTFVLWHIYRAFSLQFASPLLACRKHPGLHVQLTVTLDPQVTPISYNQLSIDQQKAWALQLRLKLPDYHTFLLSKSYCTLELPVLVRDNGLCLCPFWKFHYYIHASILTPYANLTNSNLICRQGQTTPKIVVFIGISDWIIVSRQISLRLSIALKAHPCGHTWQMIG